MKITYDVDYPNRTIYAYGRTFNGLRFYGKAKCSSEDVFDVKKGKQIARLRAEQKQLNNILKKIDKDMKTQLELFDAKMKRMEKIKNKALALYEELEEIK